MQRQPFLRLLDAIVVKLVENLAGPKRLQQVLPNAVGKLALVDANLNNGHGTLIAENYFDANQIEAR